MLCTGPNPGTLIYMEENPTTKSATLTRAEVAHIDISQEACDVADAVLDALFAKYGASIPAEDLVESADDITLRIIR